MLTARLRPRQFNPACCIKDWQIHFPLTISMSSSQYSHQVPMFSFTTDMTGITMFIIHKFDKHFPPIHSPDSDSASPSPPAIPNTVVSLSPKLFITSNIKWYQLESNFIFRRIIWHMLVHAIMESSIIFNREINIPLQQISAKSSWRSGISWALARIHPRMNVDAHHLLIYFWRGQSHVGSFIQYTSVPGIK